MWHFALTPEFIWGQPYEPKRKKISFELANQNKPRNLPCTHAPLVLIKDYKRKTYGAVMKNVSLDPA